MRSASKDTIFEKFTEEEKEIFSLYQDEFTEVFQNILLDSSGKFISNLFKRLRLSLSMKLNVFPKEVVCKIEKFIIEIYYPYQYKISYNAMKQITKTGNTPFKGSFIKHCKNTTEALHSCGKKLYQFTYKDLKTDTSNKVDSLFICLECEQVYKSHFVKLLCASCDYEYYSKIDALKEEDPSNCLQSATWVKYHCNAIINDKMKCSKCKDTLYLHKQTKQLMCIKCNWSAEPMSINWICVLCKEEFKSEAKEYNPLEFKIMKMAVKDALIEKNKAKPEVFPCDKTDCCSDVKITRFIHKKTCKGEMLLGIMNKRKILVCSLCQSLNYQDSFIWTCPKCEDKPERVPRDYNSQHEEYIRYNSSKKNNQNQSKRRESLEHQHRRQNKMPTPVKIPFDKSNNNIIGLVRKINDNKNNKENKQPNIVRKFNFDEEMSPPSSAKNSSKNVICAIANANINNNPNTTTTITNNDESNFLYEKFDSDDFDIKSKIGEGTFGKIYLVESKNKNKYAMKKIVGNSLTELESLKHEYNILHTLSMHSDINIISIYGLQTKRLDRTTFVMYVLMELAQMDWEKDILSRAKGKKYYSEGELWGIMTTLITSFAKLQIENVSHRDIKPQNILLCTNGNVKVADFGEAKQMINNKRITDKQTIRGTELFMSPLVFNALRSRRDSSFSVQHNTYKSDVYSLGLCFLFAGSLTFSSLYDLREIATMIQAGNIINKYLKGRYSAEFIGFIINMLEIEELTRSDFCDLKKRLKEIEKK